MRSRPPLVLVALLVLAAVPRLHGHDLSRSQARVDVDGARVRAALTLNVADLHQFADLDRNRDGRVSYQELDEAVERLYAAVRGAFSVTSAGAPPARTTLQGYAVVGDTAVRFDLEFLFDRPVDRVAVRSELDRLTQPDHRHLLTLATRGAVHEAVLDRATPEASFDVGAAASWTATARQFAWLGVEHIFTGYDHLAFLVGLLLATVTLRSVAKIVTSFTLAHSLTLALATFGLVSLPVRLTESVIAFSIGYVALENLLRTGAFERYRITFAFGLVHGFGFSTVLREMHLPRTGLALSLFSFNAGVEIGQLAFVAAVFPLTLVLARSRWDGYLRAAVSACVVLLAATWFVQRAFLS